MLLALKAGHKNTNKLFKQANDDPGGIRWINSDLIAIENEEYKSRNRHRHNVGLFSECVLYFGWPKPALIRYNENFYIGTCFHTNYRSFSGDVITF